MYFISLLSHSLYFSFNDTATTEIYTLSLHDALRSIYERGSYQIKILVCRRAGARSGAEIRRRCIAWRYSCPWEVRRRSEEHTSELQSQSNLVCRLLLEKKKS